MRVASRRKLDTAGVVLQFQEQCPDPNPAATPAVAALAGIVRQAEELLTRRQREEEAAQMALTARGSVEAEIRGLLDQLIPLGRVVSRQQELPPLDLGRIDPRHAVALVTRAATALEWGRSHAEPLVRYGMPPSLLDQLADAVSRHRSIVQAREASLAFVNSVPSEIERLVKASEEVIEHLDALNRIRFATDPLHLADWKRAKRVQWSATVSDLPAAVAPVQPTT